MNMYKKGVGSMALYLDKDFIWHESDTMTNDDLLKFKYVCKGVFLENVTDNQWYLLRNVKTWSEPDCDYLIYSDIDVNNYYFALHPDTPASSYITRKQFNFLNKVKPSLSVTFEAGIPLDKFNVKGDRHNSDKSPLSIVLEAKHAIDGCAKILQFGANKYSRGNWRNGLNHTEIADSLIRHLSAYLAGEDNDPESGLPHVDHVLCNSLFLSEMTKIRPDLDDRSHE